MSFRLRVLGLVVLVAVSATAATAWLTLREATQQISDSATADRVQLDKITKQIKAYGVEHGTWEGVSNLVTDLHQQSGQRIHLVAESGIVLVDTDTELGRTARPLGTMSSVVDPRPVLDLDLPDSSTDATGVALEMIKSYRVGVRFAACLTRHGVDVAITESRFGIPGFAAGPPGESQMSEFSREQAINDCHEFATNDLTGSVRKAQLGCDSKAETWVGGTTGPDLRRGDDNALRMCLLRAFVTHTSDVAPVPVQVYLGSRDDSTSVLAAGPLLTAAAGVAAVAIIGTAVLSRRVLRPIDTLTTASRRLGRGDLTSRVPVPGNDELAELARSFNWMADSLQRGEERQRRLVADVAHELRTPLANLRGYLEALKDGVIPADADLFASLHEEAVLQQRIVDDLQELALAEAGTLAYHRSAVDLAELLANVRTAHAALADAAGVDLVVLAEHVSVDADPDRLRQVIGNLITNAVRATPPGGSVTLHAERSGAGAVLRVVDTGSGIDPDSLPYVFDRFWRADSARGRRTGGSGLGLAIAQQIVTDHGGIIRVSSQLGTGTTFTISLPGC